MDHEPHREEGSRTERGTARDRFLGALLGLAVGDAVGTTVEFRPPGTFQPVTDMVGGGPFGLAPGQWTDDTSMALCLAESLIERGGFDPVRAIRHAGESSRTTHGAATCVDACRYFAGLLVGALQGRGRDELLEDHFAPVSGYWAEHPLVPEIGEIARGSFKEREPPQIKGTGYVVRSLEAALWAFHRSENFQEGCLLAANLGDDADTTAAVYGQLAGAFYGASGIPSEWRRSVSMAEEIGAFAIQLHQAGGPEAAPPDRRTRFQGNPMNCRIHRGTNEIGATCVELEADGSRVVLDLGLPLSVAGVGP